MRNRSWPILTLGFGSLLVLIALLELGAVRRAEQISEEASALNESFQRREDVLNEIRSELHLGETVVRDFLLDTSSLAGARLREELLELRSTIAAQLHQLEQADTPEQSDILKDLRAGIDAYWDVLNPVFAWTPAEKTALSSDFLQTEILPRRDAVLAITREIRDFNEANFAQEQEENRLSQQGFRRYLRTIGAAALLLGVLVAAVSVFRISNLERRAEAHQNRQRVRVCAAGMQYPDR